MDIFADKCWPGTLIILFLGMIVAFMVICVLGLFVDPSMPLEVRQGVVMAWGFFAVVYTAVVTIGRHG